LALPSQAWRAASGGGESARQRCALPPPALASLLRPRLQAPAEGREAGWNMDPFLDRADAGRSLASQLLHLRGQDVVVLGIPRGGVPVAYEVAVALKAPLDVFLVRKLGVPGYEELAMGAIASGGVRVLNATVISALGAPQVVIDTVAARQGEELLRRERLYRGDRPLPPLRGRTVVLVDDGLATGASMRAAVEGLRAFEPARIVVGVPVASRSICESFEDAVDEMVCAKTPSPFFSVGSWYRDFAQASDEEVKELLDKARARPLAGGEGLQPGPA
jgi:predicted phosphoribosyltransferase